MGVTGHIIMHMQEMGVAYITESAWILSVGCVNRATKKPGRSVGRRAIAL